MIRSIFLVFCLTLSYTISQSQTSFLPSTHPQLFDKLLKPFYHGVASGDPLADRVIIWTKITPDNQPKFIKGQWQVATDPEMKNVVKSGKFNTNASKNYTVKIDVIGLQAGTTYYYQFTALGAKSLVGRTQTAPNNGSEHLRFAIVSCSNYEAGYFNAYAKIAQRNDLDAVIHLGDYIYEYGQGGYGDSTLKNQRQVLPKNEILSLEDYRTRYSIYRLDKDLRSVHQQHPFIVVWDDHETANDSYKEGAENHSESEGSWANRRAIARQVYAEWLPIRGEAQSIYRKINYGNLADLILLDTRLEGREKQIKDVKDAQLYAENRTILGNKQREWFLNELKNSQAQWKIIGNQVIFAEFNIGWASAAIQGYTPEQLESRFLDIWDGYPAERTKIIDFIKNNQINNVVFLTGDFHTTFAFDIAQRPTVFSEKGKTPDYLPETGVGSVAVEFVSPSITSGNFGEQLGEMRAKMLEYQMNKPLPNGINPNPHMKYAELTRHGYYILDLTKSKAQADWYFVDTIKQVSDNEVFTEGWFSNDKDNHLQKSTTPSPPKKQLKLPAPK
jgi:alkaline phosphatase D